MAQWKKSYNSFQEMLNDIHPDNGMDIDTGHAVNATKGAAIALIATAILGDPEGGEDVTKRDFTIVMEGFSNPNHEPREGQPKDYVTITLRQK